MEKPHPSKSRNQSVFSYLRVGIPIAAVLGFSLILFQNFITIPDRFPAAGDFQGRSQVILTEADGHTQSFKTIQAAVDAAPEYSSIVVDHGAFTEHVKISGKSNLQLRAITTATLTGLSIEKSHKVEVIGFEVDSLNSP